MYRTVRAGSESPASANAPKGDALIFYVNGRKVIDERPDPELYLAYYLRQKLNLRGTKLSCHEAQCGACTVMLSKYDPVTDKVKHISINACILPIAAVHGCAVTTIEGVGSLSRGLHPVQERLSKGHGSQCGFCTPGFIISMYTLLRNNHNPTKQDIELQLQGNLCRCTGYRPILESFYGFTKDKCACGSFACCKSGESDGKEKCCRDKNEPAISDWSHCRPYDPSQEPIFPSELAKERSFIQNALTLIGPRVTWFRPTSLAQLHEIMQSYPDAAIGGTYSWASRCSRTSADPHHKRVITTMDIPELKTWRFVDGGLHIGSGLTIEEMHKVLEHAIANKAVHETKFFDGLSRMITLIAIPHLRNFVSWSGNIASGFPISDMAICLLASSSTLHIAGAGGGERLVKLDQNGTFFNGGDSDSGEDPWWKCYKVDLKQNELITGVTIPFSTEHDKFHVFKQGHRHGPDSAIVNAAMRVTVSSDKHVEKAAFAFGGLTNRPILAENTAKEIFGKEWDENLLEKTTSTLKEDVTHIINNTGHHIGYRTLLCMSFFRKFFELVKLELEGKKSEATEFNCLIEYPHLDPMKATQIYHDVTHDKAPADPVGRPIMHQSGQKHTTGEAIYIDDTPTILGECHLVLIYSERAHARIKSVETSEALKMPQVLGYFNAKDIPPNGSNFPAVPFGDEPMFAEEKVFAIGQVIGAIVAEDQLIAQRAASLVKVHYEDLPPVLSCPDAIAAGTMFPQEVHHKRGQPPAAVFPECHLVLKGDISLGFQEHFYLETNCCLVIPKDGDEYEIYSSTQALSFAQMEVAAALGIPASKVVAKQKRIGGGFGGKHSSHSKTLNPSAVAARKLKRPIRAVMNRHDDFACTGKRHQMYWKYETAGKEILQRLEPYMAANPKGTWEQWISAAFFDRCHLAAHAHCKLSYPDVEVHNPGYYVSGAAAAIVEVDCLTGDHRILRCELVFDLGESMNPAVDIGQIEGAFLQGVGLTTMENLLFDKEGKLVTPSALTYKVPSVSCVPREFNVSLIKNENFKQNVYNSKAVGEPPLALGYSVHFAVKDAILAFRASMGETGVFVDYGSPLTPEKIRMQMHDRLASMVDPKSPNLADV